MKFNAPTRPPQRARFNAFFQFLNRGPEHGPKPDYLQSRHEFFVPVEEKCHALHHDMQLQRGTGQRDQARQNDLSSYFLNAFGLLRL